MHNEIGGRYRANTPVLVELELAFEASADIQVVNGKLAANPGEMMSPEMVVLVSAARRFQCLPLVDLLNT